MTNLMQRSAAFLATKLKSAAVAGRTVRYWRGQTPSAALQAVCTEKDYDLVDEQGFVTSVQMWDWTFATADLLIRGEAVAPQNNDKIAETLNGAEIEYAAAPIGTRPCFEWADTSGVLMVVHTKRIK